MKILTSLLAALVLAILASDTPAQRVVRTRTVTRGGNRVAFVGTNAAFVASPGYSTSAAFVATPGLNVNVGRQGFFARRNVNVNVGGAAFIGQPAAFTAQPYYYQQQNFVAPVQAFRFNSYSVPQQNFVAPTQAFTVPQMNYTTSAALTAGSCQQNFTAPLVAQPTQAYSYQQAYTYQQPVQAFSYAPQQVQVAPDTSAPQAGCVCQTQQSALQAAPALAPQAYSGCSSGGAAFTANNVFRGRLVR